VIRILKYVPFPEITERYGQGWFIASLLGPPHGFYAVLMELELPYNPCK
jgi:hypothetical protein